MKLVGDPKCLPCGSEEYPIHAFLGRKIVTNLWRNIELWMRDALNQHVKVSKNDKIFGLNNGDILEVIHISKTGGPLSL